MNEHSTRNASNYSAAPHMTMIGPLCIPLVEQITPLMLIWSTAEQLQSTADSRFSINAE
jgi:hypothetical protein